MKVAALIYFDDQTTLNQAKQILSDLKTGLSAALIEDKHPMSNVQGAGIEATIVGEYDPETGSPVWYIP